MALEAAACLRPNALSSTHELLALYLDIDIKLSSQIKQNPSSSTTTLDLPSHAFEVSATRSPIFRASANLCEPSSIPKSPTANLPFFWCPYRTTPRLQPALRRNTAPELAYSSLA